MIKAQNLRKTYRGGKVAVDNISFDVQPGKVTGFLGPNGAGKSTTMRLMLGLDSGAGLTTFDDKLLRDYASPAKLIGILLEAKAFHPTRSAQQHLKVLADAGGIPKTRVDEVLDIVGLKDVARKGPGKFSLGMSQRLGIAAALLGAPKYLMLDEPANGLDPEGVAWLRKFLSDYADQGHGVFVSSHLLSEMQLMADNIIVIGKGKLIASTSIGELTSGQHASVFARSGKKAEFEKAIKAKKFAYERLDDGFKITGTSTDEVGRMAFEAGLPLLELSSRNASLEEVFLKLTEGSEEFAAKEEGKK